MIDIDVFYKSLGATESLDQGDQLLLQDSVRVMSGLDSVTIVFDSLSSDQDTMASLFALSRDHINLIPFTTRSGHLALQFFSQQERDDTQVALSYLSHAIDRML